jgi:molecular chaperone GrpE
VSSDRQVDFEREAVAPPETAPSPPVEGELDAAATEAAVAEAAIAETDGLAAAAGDGDGAGAEAGDEPLEDDPEAELREQAGRYLELAQRTQADFDNYRKRMTREVRAAEARGIGRLARELLPALDNLERALAAVESAEPTNHLSEGIRLVTKELSAALGRTGIEGYDPTGEPFDPNQHEAVAQHEVEGAESGTVVQVLQSGYRLNEAILRPARVIVAS